MYEAFKARAEVVSAQVHRFAGTSDALAFITGLLRQEGVSSAHGAHAVWAAGPLLQGLDREKLTRDISVRFDVTRALAATARVGLSQMDWASADTGTLVQVATAVEQRLVSTLPKVHVAILPSARLLPDLTAVLDRLSPRDHTYLAFITGPSRTADIERVLTIGVHGPARPDRRHQGRGRLAPRRVGRDLRQKKPAPAAPRSSAPTASKRCADTSSICAQPAR